MIFYVYPVELPVEDDARQAPFQEHRLLGLVLAVVVPDPVAWCQMRLRRLSRKRAPQLLLERPALLAEAFNRVGIDVAETEVAQDVFHGLVRRTLASAPHVLCKFCQVTLIEKGLYR